MRPLMFVAALASALLVPASAAAETRLIKVPYRYLLVPPMEAGSKRVSEGGSVFEFPLRWASAAVLAHDFEVTADSRRKTLMQGQALVETKLQFTDPAFAPAKSFCTPRVADPTAGKGGFLLNNLIGGALARSLTDGQFCIIDRDGDGMAEYSVLVNAGSPAAREPHPIEPVAYTLTAGAIVSEGDSFKVRYRGGKNSFELQIIEQGHTRLFQTFEYQDGNGHHRFQRLFSGRKIADGVYETGAPGIDFKISSYDPNSASTLIEWPSTSRPVIVPIPDDVKTRYY